MTINYLESALVLFYDGQRLYGYSVELEIAAPNPDIMRLPSLLGREILDRWNMTYHRAADDLSFEIDSSDVTVTI